MKLSLFSKALKLFCQYTVCCSVQNCSFSIRKVLEDIQKNMEERLPSANSQLRIFKTPKNQITSLLLQFFFKVRGSLARD